MAMTAMRVDERERAALARLTANEKECLRRRLLPQTAKEMALDLGISPHAVEKRLKMARAKLGVSSSLAAARLLVAAEGYGSVGAQPAELLPVTGSGQIEGAGPTRFWLVFLLIGAAVMLSVVAILAVLPQAVPAPAAESIAAQTTIFDEKGRSIPARKTDMSEASAYISENFNVKDTDHSEYLDPSEASSLESRDRFRDKSLPPVPPAGQPDTAAERKWMAKLDTDRNGRVSREEYISYMMPWTLLSGVPTAWRVAKADAEARAKASAPRH